MSKVVWKGSITFGLVNIDIQLYSAISQHSLGFKLLHAKCETPIQYKRWCDSCKKEVDWSEIVKGFKLSTGHYFILTKENLEKLKPEKTDFINIIEFVEQSALNTIYFDQHYYVKPSKSADKVFFLFKEALKKTNKIGIGQFVMRDKEYICAIQSYNDILLLTTLNYAYEVRSINISEIKIPKLKTDEIKLAQELISKLTVKKFDINKFKDTFAQKLKERIHESAKKGGKKIKKAKVIKKPKHEEVSLINMLKKSLKVPYASKIKGKAIIHARSR